MLEHPGSVIVINFGLNGIYMLCFKTAWCWTFAITSPILFLTEVDKIFTVEINYLHYFIVATCNARYSSCVTIWNTNVQYLYRDLIAGTLNTSRLRSFCRFWFCSLSITNICVNCWLCSSVVERLSFSGGLSLSCAWPAADGWPIMWVNRPIQVN